MSDKTRTIRELNDMFRQEDSSVPGQILITRGLIDLLEEQQTPLAYLKHIVSEYDTFTDDNDPHGEHDFGAFEFLENRCFWKIDYYDPTLKWSADDPTDIQKTVRVLTIMLASEY